MLRELKEKGVKGYIILEPQEDFNKSIIGYDEKQNRLIYSYDLMISSLRESFSEDPDFLEEETLEMAEEYIFFNTFREIESLGKNRPIIMELDLFGEEIC